MRRWLKRVVAAFAVWAFILGFAVFTERDPHPIPLAAAVAAGLAVVWLCTDIHQGEETPEWSLYHAPAPARTFDPRFSRLSQELNEASDRRSASRAVHTSLSKVADRILLDRYDIDRASNPVEARAILGERAWSYLTTKPGDEKVVFSAELFDVLDRLESL